MLFQIYYQQSADERYNTDVNGAVRKVLETARIEIVEEWGGSHLDRPYTSGESAENAFVVDTTLEKIQAVSGRVAEILHRPVEVIECEPEEKS